MTPGGPEGAETLEALVRRVLAEDIGPGDRTSEHVVAHVRARAWIQAKEEGIVAGTAPAALVFRVLDPGAQVTILIEDGGRATPGARVMEIAARSTALLAGERSAVNFLQHLSGIATLTHRFVSEASGTGALIYDTRKTTPGLRLLEKAAVVAGGGRNHRTGLWDQILVKGNHLALSRHARPSRVETITATVQALRKELPGERTIEVEVQNLEEARAAARAGADILLLDNMDLGGLREVVSALRDEHPSVVLEASGGMTLERLGEVARTGVDRISVGRLTHSARALDLAMYVAAPDTKHADQR